MGTKIAEWRPSWWSNEVHGSAWDRVKEAMRRDWMQTKHDAGAGGHEMNQSATDTVKQAAGKEHLPTINQANPPKVIADFSEIEIPYAYGFGAQRQFGAQHPKWNPELESNLSDEWSKAHVEPGQGWEAVSPVVRRGYEHEGRHSS